MPSYVTPKKNTAFITYFALPSFATQGSMQSAPTLASGDFKVSIDGGALANLATLPTNTPGGVMVKASLSAAEMNGDNITIVCIDQTSPKEWCDTVLNIQTSARQMDDLAYPNTSGRGMDIDASGGVEVGSFQAGAITAAAYAAGAIDAAALAADAGTEIGTAVWASATRTLTANTNLNDLSAAGVRAAVGLASANLDTQLTAIDDFLDTEIAAIKAKTDALPTDPADASDIAASFATVNGTLATIAGYIDTEVASILAAVDTEVAAIKAKTDNLPADPADASDIAARFTTLDTAVADLPTNAELATALGTADDAVLAQVALVKAKTDLIPAAPAGVGDIPSAATIADAVWDEAIAGHAVAGSTGEQLAAAGASGDPWATALPGAYAAGTAGKIVGDNINATVSSRLASASYTAPLDAAGTRTAVGLASANLDTQIGTLATAAALTTVDNEVAVIDGLVDAIKAKTDSLTFTVAGQVDSNIQYVNDVQVNGTGAAGNEWGP